VEFKDNTTVVDEIKKSVHHWLTIYREQRLFTFAN
jgi:hypothetical protein